MERIKVNNIDEYIASFPVKTQRLLKQVRAAIRKAAPEAEEKISYAIPTFALHGNLVHFAAYDHHIGFYPTPSAISKFEKELKGYQTSRGAIQFPISEPLPLDLIDKITRFRVQEALTKAEKAKVTKPTKKTAGAASPKKAEDGKLIAGLSAPAARALQHNGITSLKKLAAKTEKEVLGYHGMGKTSLPIMRAALAQQGLRFREA